MSTTTRNNKKPKLNARPRNKAVKGKPMPQSQAEFYKHAWNVCFNKLSKSTQKALTNLLKEPEEEIRGRIVINPQVLVFVRTVRDMGEALYDKAVAKGAIKLG